MNCPKCGTFHRIEAAFCSSCGTRLQIQSCQTCHHPNLLSARFCVKCGTNLQTSAAATPPEERSTSTPVHHAIEPTLAQEISLPKTAPRVSDVFVPSVQVRQTVNEELRYAGFWARFAAFLIDEILLLIAVGIVGALFSLTLVRSMNESNLFNIIPEQEFDFSTLPFDPHLFVLFAGWYYAYIMYGMVRWLYFSVMEASVLQATVGKMLLGIKVTDIHGNRLKFGRAVGRYFSKIISDMTLYIGYIMAAGTKRKQALHDLIADCLVVRK